MEDYGENSPNNKEMQNTTVTCIRVHLYGSSEQNSTTFQNRKIGGALNIMVVVERIGNLSSNPVQRCVFHFLLTLFLIKGRICPPLQLWENSRPN